MDDVSWRNIDILINALVYKQPITGIKNDLSTIFRMRVGKLCFLVYAKKCKDAPVTTYEIGDFFTVEIPVLCDIGDGELFPVSQYSILQTNDFIALGNINFDILLPSFQKVEYNKYTFERANLFLLDMLNAYDIATGIRKEKILKTCNDFIEWIMQAPNEDLPQNIKIINKLQIVKRTRQLSKNEIEMLCKIVESSEEGEFCKVAAYLLLDQQEAAEVHFSKLTEEEQGGFKKFPIYHFWMSEEIET